MGRPSFMKSEEVVLTRAGKQSSPWRCSLGGWRLHGDVHQSHRFSCCVLMHLLTSLAVMKVAATVFI